MKIKQNSTVQKTFSRLSTDLRRRKIFFALSDDVPERSRYHSSAATNIKNKTMKHISWFVLQSPLESFSFPTFIIRREETYLKRCLRARLLPFIKMIKCLLLA